MKNVMGVYGIRRISDGLFYYIGSSKDVWGRWLIHKCHMSCQNSSKEYQYFHDELLIKNLDDFESVLLDELVGFIHIDDKTRLHKRLVKREKMYIGKYKALGHPIATQPEYQDAPMTHKHHSDETKIKISAARTGTHWDDETKAKISAKLTGVPKSDETKSKLSAASTGEKNPAKRQDVRDKISAKLSGENNPMKRPDVRAKMTGRIYITNGIDERHVTQDEYNNLDKSVWKPGRKTRKKRA